MEADETGTLGTLKSRRKEVLVPLIARHQGRLFKVTGDGVLVDFASAVNARNARSSYRRNSARQTPTYLRPGISSCASASISAT
jgi:class 3 adenylate cyclase